MFPAQTIYSDGATATSVHSPWFPRGGDFAQFVIQVPRMSSAASTLILAVQMLHKNSDDPGDGTSVGSLVLIPANLLATTTQFYFEITNGFKERVRYLFGLQNVGGSGTSWATFKVLSPQWFNKI